MTVDSNIPGTLNLLDIDFIAHKPYSFSIWLTLLNSLRSDFISFPLVLILS